MPMGCKTKTLAQHFRGKDQLQMLLLYMLFMLYMTATSIQVIWKSIVKIHKSGQILKRNQYVLTI